MRILSLLWLLIAASTASAGQIIEVEPGGTYSVKASITDLTSIGMADNLRLQAVFGVETMVTISKDEAFGRAIIKPTTKNRFSLIVTDENGDSYSLTVTPVQGPGEVITLKRKSHQMNEALLTAEREMPFTNRLKRVIKTVAAGGVPGGYDVETKNQVVPLWVEAELKLVGIYRGNMTVEHYQIRNISGTEMRLDEREFRALGPVLSVAIRNHILPNQAVTDVYVVRDATGVAGAGNERT